MGPFMGSHPQRPARDSDVVAETVESWADFDDPDYGFAALALKCGARGSVMQQIWLFGGGVMVDADGRFVRVERGLFDGRTAKEVFVAVAGAREGLAETARQVMRGTYELARTAYGWNPGGVKGYGVLARAMRARRPGIVFAHAASADETDPLDDLDARLFVGLMPVDHERR